MKPTLKFFWFVIVGAALAGLFAVSAGFAGPLALGSAPAAVGQLVISFMFMPPTEIEPTYHTAIWLENKDGKLVKTLFVSTELSKNE